MTTFDEILEGLRKAADAERQMARVCERKAEMFEAEIRGMETARSALLEASKEVITEGNSLAAFDPPAEVAAEHKRQRRDVRGMVLAALQEAKLGISTESLAEKLDITKAQAESALEHHAGKGDARGNNGIWFPQEPAASTPIAKPVPSWIQPDGQTTIDLNHGSGFQPGSSKSP